MSSFSLNSNFYSAITNNSAGSANGSGWGNATTVGNAIYGVLNDNLANVSAATLTAAGQASNTTWRPLSSPTGDEFLFGTFNVSLGAIAGAGVSDKTTSYQWLVPAWNNGGSHNSKPNAYAQISMDGGAFKYPQTGGASGGAYDPANYPAPVSTNFVNFVVPGSAGPGTVAGVDATDFNLVSTGTATGTITSVSGNGTNYTVTIGNVSGEGTLGLNLVDDDSITDGVGNKLGGTGTGNGNFTGQVYTVDTVPPAVVSINRVGASPTNASSAIRRDVPRSGHRRGHQ